MAAWRSNAANAHRPREHQRQQGDADPDQRQAKPAVRPTLRKTKYATPSGKGEQQIEQVAVGPRPERRREDMAQGIADSG